MGRFDPLVVFLDEHVHELDALRVREITMGMLPAAGLCVGFPASCGRAAGLSVELERPPASTPRGVGTTTPTTQMEPRPGPPSAAGSGQEHLTDQFASGPTPVGLVANHRGVTCAANFAVLDGVQQGLGEAGLAPAPVTDPGYRCVAFRQTSRRSSKSVLRYSKGRPPKERTSPSRAFWHHLRSPKRRPGRRASRGFPRS